jgi:hypothetical protein
MRSRSLVLIALLLSGCPSLDGFVDAEKLDAGPAGDGFLSLEDAARLCSKLQTCPNLSHSIGFSLLIPMDAQTYSSCIDTLAGPLPPSQLGAVQQQAQTLTCILKASDCAAAGACLPYRIITQPDPSCAGLEGGANGACSADAKTACGPGLISHCGHAYFGNASCVLAPDGFPVCVSATTCSLPSIGSCSGTVLSYCDPGNNNNTVTLDCAYWGTTCGTDQGSGLQDCLLNGFSPRCLPPDSVKCVSDRVRACYGAVFGEIDCTAVGGTCDPFPTPHCARPADKCKQTDPDLNACDGDRIALCVGGRRQTLDCTSLGLKCLPAPVGSFCG